MNNLERTLVINSIGAIMQRVDDLVASGKELSEAKREAIAGFTFTGNTAPLKQTIINSVEGATLADLSKSANHSVNDRVFEAWRDTNKRSDTNWSRFRFWFWSRFGF